MRGHELAQGGDKARFVSKGNGPARVGELQADRGVVGVSGDDDGSRCLQGADDAHSGGSTCAGHEYDLRTRGIGRRRR